jgi:hypothetical protein
MIQAQHQTAALRFLLNQFVSLVSLTGRLVEFKQLE